MEAGEFAGSRGEGGVKGKGFAVAFDGEGGVGAGLAFLDEPGELHGVKEELIVELEEEVAGLEAGLVGGRAGVDIADHEGRSGAAGVGDAGGGLGDGDAEEAGAGCTRSASDWCVSAGWVAETSA